MAKYIALLVLVFSGSVSAEAWRWVSQPGVELGSIPNGAIRSLKASYNGRFLTFTSSASNLVTDDNNYLTDLFILDTEINVLQRVNVTSAGEQAIDSDIYSFSQASDDGRYVAFTTKASNFPFYNNKRLLYVKDLVTGALTLESKKSNGNAFSVSSSYLFLSNGAQKLLFSTETALVGLDDNDKTDVYSKNLFDSSSFDIISVARNGGVATDDVYLVNVSDNLRYVILESNADDLVTQPNSSKYNTYLRDLNSGTTVFVNVTPNGSPSIYGQSSPLVLAVVNNQGQVIHCSSAKDLINNDNNNLNDIFLFYNGMNHRIILQANGQEITDIGCDNRISTLAVSNSDNSFTFAHWSAQLTAQDNNQSSDVFRYDIGNQQTELISSNLASVVSNGSSQKVVMGGGKSSNVYFISDASDLTHHGINSLYPLIYQYNVTNKQINFINHSFSPVSSLVSSASTPLISQDQTQLVFASFANNITADDAVGGADLYHLNLLTNERHKIATKLAGILYDNTGILRTQADFSPNGRYVVFLSRYFQPIDTIDLMDNYVFLYDLTTGQYSQIAVGSEPKVNNQGLVVFSSAEDDLVPGDNNNKSDIFIFNPDNQSISRVSTRVVGPESNGTSTSPDIGGEGLDTWITFRSNADNLIAGNVNSISDIFLTNWPSGSFIRVSENDAGVGGNYYSESALISDDGQSVAFVTQAKNLTNHNYPVGTSPYQLFAYDRISDELELISLQSNGDPAAEGVYPGSYSISTSGKFLAFASSENNIVNNDYNYIQDLFLRNRESQSTIRLSVNLDEEELNYSSSNFNPHVVEDFSVSPPLLGVAFTGHPEILGNMNLPGYREVFLYQQDGPGVKLNTQVVGQGHVSGNLGYSCGANSNCSNTYPLGTILQLFTVPSNGYTFVGWSGASCAGSTQNPCAHLMDQEKEIKVTFVSNNDLIFFNHFED